MNNNMNCLFVVSKLLVQAFKSMAFTRSILLWYNFFYSDSCVTLIFYLYAHAVICFSMFAGRECHELPFTILRRRYFIADFLCRSSAPRIVQAAVFLFLFLEASYLLSNVY